MSPILLSLALNSNFMLKASIPVDKYQSSPLPCNHLEHASFKNMSLGLLKKAHISEN
jgi:hypothetical protein